MYPTIQDDDDFLAALCFDQRICSNDVEDPYAYIQTNQDNMFLDFWSSGVNLQQDQGQVCNIGAQFDSFTENLPQFCGIRGENNGGVVYSNSSRSAQELDLAASFSGVLQQETLQVCSFRRRTEDSGPNVHQEPIQVCSDVVEINSSSSVGNVKEEQDHVGEECSRKRARTGSCSKPGTKACREKMRREKLNDRFMDLSSVLEPGRTLKTDKSAIVDDAIRVVNQLRVEVHELKETNQKLLEDIKSLKEEKNELREEKLVLKADKEKIEKELKSMVVPSPALMPSHPLVYSSYGYYPNMQMWPYFKPKDRDTANDHKHTSYAA